MMRRSSPTYPSARARRSRSRFNFWAADTWAIRKGQLAPASWHAGSSASFDQGTTDQGLRFQLCPQMAPEDRPQRYHRAASFPRDPDAFDEWFEPWVQASAIKVIGDWRKEA